MRQVTRKSLVTMAAAGGLLAIGGGNAHADSGAQGSTTNSPGVLSGNSVQAPVHVPVNVCGNTVNVVGVLNPALGNSCANTSGKGKHRKPGGSDHGQPGHPGSHGNPGQHGDPGQHGGSGQHGNPGQHGGSGQHGNPGHHNGGGAQADGHTSNSPGVGSGNNVQAPVHVPVNACGNGVTVIGLLNPVFGNDCANDSTPSKPGPGTQKPPGEPHNPGEPEEPGTPGTPGKPEQPRTPEKPAPIGEPNTPGTQTVTKPKATEVLAQTGAGVPLGLAIPAAAGMLLGGALLYRRARASA